jgi:DNA-damage-inducible protein J
MNKTATVHARIDSKTKTASERVLEKIGMTPTDAVRLLYRQIALRKEFPLELRVPNKVTAQTLRKSDRGEDIESFDSVEDMVGTWDE